MRRTDDDTTFSFELKTTDNFFVKVAGKSWAVDYTEFEIITTTPLQNFTGTDHWGPGHDHIISLGFLVSVVICIPFGYLNLDENMKFQWLSLWSLLLFTGEFLVQFCLNIPQPGNGPSHTPAWTSVDGQLHVLGTIVFAYGYVLTIPSWVNEKKLDVSVNKSVWFAGTVSLIMKVLSGLLGSWAFVLIVDNKYGGQCRELPHGQDNCTVQEGSDNILNLLARFDQPEITQYSSYLWNLSTIIPGIPILSIMLRYNYLVSNGPGGKFGAFAWAVLIPWLLCMFTYRLGIIADICTWAGVVVMGFANFVLPVMVYRAAVIKHPLAHEVSEAREKEAKRSE